MARLEYSFIDIAALDAVRARLLRGDGVIVLAADLETVLFANGPGASLLGHEDIVSIMGASPGLSMAQRRQIAATSGFPRIGAGRTVMLRLNSRFGTSATIVEADELEMPDGQPAVMLSSPSPADQAGDAQIAARAISGFEGEGRFAALVGEDGAVEAATPGWHELRIDSQALSRGAFSGPRVGRRMIEAGGRRLPMGQARLSDDPLKLLVVVVDDGTPVVGGSDVADPEFPVASAAAMPHDGQGETVPLEADQIPNGRTDAVETETEATSGESATVAKGDEHIVRDDWYFGTEEDGVKRPPIRFVWKTDAEGRFSAVSAEFLQLVGLAEDDLTGRLFRDVSAEFGLDPAGTIADLLERRDTWSGRMVNWPVAGTDWALPVDLAALPAYSRDRRFEGFRGFGIARPADVTRRAPAPDPVEREDDATLTDPFQGENPAIVVEPGPGRRGTDKVIRLAEHRAPVERKLSVVESTAFREIGDRLKRFTQSDDGESVEMSGGGEPVEAIEAIRNGSGAVQPADATSRDDDEQPSPTVETMREEPASEISGEKDMVSPILDAGKIDAADQPVVERPDHETTAVPAMDGAETAHGGDQSDGRQAGGSSTPPSHETHVAEGRHEELAILGRLPVPLLVHAGDVLHFANREFLALTGYDSLEALAQAGGLYALITGTREDGDAATGNALRIRAADGEEFAAEGHLQSVPWEGGKALLLALRSVGSVGDRELEPAELRDRLAEMRTIVDTATDGLVILGEDGLIRSISRPAEALFGFDTDDVEGKPFASLFAMESQRSVQDYVAGLIEPGVASILNDGREVIAREAQGRFIPLFMTIGRLASGELCAVLRDITQWKRAEEELTQAKSQAERASSQKSDFLARISHEIRTPLNAIIGFSELMMDEKFGPIGSERYRDYLRDINRSGNHVLDLVNDLLDISKIEAGEQEMSYEAVSLNDTLAEAVAMMQPQANRERVIIRSSFAARLPEVVADLRSIRQIALNLLSNAVRYTPAGGQVIVSTAYEAAGDVVMRVRDTGIGMTHAEIEQALKPFRRINALRRPRGDGTGLGLPLTKAMVEANRARFAISSTPGEGTLVEISFPSTRVLAS